MRILIDGDGCPRVIKEKTYDLGLAYNVEVIFYTTIAHISQRNHPNCIILDNEMQSVDIRIANDTKKKDIVVTQDYGLASMVIAKGGNPIGVRGEIFTAENIDSYLLVRHENQKLRKSGLLRGGPPKFSHCDLVVFQEGLANLVEKNRKK
ncbi:DUF188 domain-containing protein [Alkalicella caledoniensis]|uniref:DUF188 domain-containing protein n=1 Tax=Alkalicella caledoniensis TaxID=2731377 RepID=A0A7G9WC20_ALKCA|nr:DUF188 domain-containing protein [Alkalicella caledoniensis]QNO16232.1 DUF188 domain-containing protein [Alkalicella caledoniensis]